MPQKSTKPNTKTGAKKSSDDDVDFEAALQELEALVDQMEGGDLSLDESLQAFERGVQLTRACQGVLQAAELKVQALTDDGELEPLAPEAE